MSVVFTTGPSIAQINSVAPFMSEYQADRMLLRKFYTIETAPETSERLQSLFKEYLKKIDELDFNQMNNGSKADYILFKRDLNESLALQQRSDQEFMRLKVYFPFADEIYQLEKQSRRGTAMEGQKIAAQLNEINKTIAKLNSSLASVPPFDESTARSAAEIARDIRSAVRKVYDFYNNYDPMFSWWVSATYKETDNLLPAYAAALEKHRKASGTNAQKIEGIPVGRAEILRKLKYEMIAYTPEELIEMANKEMAWCDQEMLQATREMGLKDDWKAALERVKNTYVAPGKQPELIVRLYQDAIGFIKTNNLMTIPPLAEETWGMIMMTPERQLVNPFFTGGDEISISYPTSEMSYDDKMMSMRGNNPYFSRATVQHELIPGHNLQYFMARRYNTHRRYNTPFWMEGWALYWELLLYDMGFAKTPEEKIGMLFWRKHRCARILFSLNFQIGKWSAQECVDYLVDHVGHERANAEGEVRRSVASWTDPLYQIAYLTGGLQIMSLKKELVDTKKMTIKAFNDAFIRENSMPVEMARAILTNQPLEKNFQAKWKFYN
ncbi:DUF885 family protein [Pedobacter metabolipauper]|nr:DUF885 family protein [Pedobacter metabolipauper]